MNYYPIEHLKELTAELYRLAARCPSGIYETDSPDSVLAIGDGGEELKAQARKNEELILTLEGLTDPQEIASFTALEIQTAISESESLL